MRFLGWGPERPPQIASAKDDDPISVRPFEAITFGLGGLWP